MGRNEGVLKGGIVRLGTVRYGGVFARELPYDAEVEYIESSGTQYIDTGVNPEVEPRVISDFTVMNSSDTDFFGNTNSGVSGSSAFIADIAYGRLQYYRFASAVGVNTGITVQIGEQYRHRWSIGKNVSLDGTVKYTSPYTYAHDPNQPTILIFRSRRGNSATFRLYSFVLFDGGEIVRDFIPVRYTDGGVSKGALYDRAHPTGGPLGNGLYANIGTGSFTIGPDIDQNYSICDVEYIQSSGTQWIDSQINPKTAPRVVADMEFLNADDRDYWGNANAGVPVPSIYIADFRSYALMYYRYGSNTYVGVPFTTSGRHVWSVGKEVRVDGDLKYTSPNTYAYDSIQSNILIFKSGRGNPSAFRLYSLKIYDGDRLERDFVPVKMSKDSGESEGALLDLVSGKCFTNRGTGAFMIGPHKTN